MEFARDQRRAGDGIVESAEAAARLRKSSAARDLFGDAFVDHYAYSREWEDRQQRKAITDWQKNRYFEII